MRNIVLNLAITLDGFIAGPNGEYDWCFADADYGMEEFMASIDALVMGRKSYEVLLEFGPPYPEKQIYVFSNTMHESPYPNVHFVNDDLPGFVSKIKTQIGKDIWLFGGTEITNQLFAKDLIDRMVLSIHPLILGKGISLFTSGISRALTMTNSIAYPSGLLQITYEKKLNG